MGDPEEMETLICELYEQLPLGLRPKEKVINAEEVIMEAIEYIISLKNMRIGQSLIKKPPGITFPVLAPKPRPTTPVMQIAAPVMQIATPVVPPQVVEVARKKSTENQNGIAIKPKPTKAAIPEAPKFYLNDTDTVQRFVLPTGAKVIKLPGGKQGVLISGNEAKSDSNNEQTILELAPNTKIPIIRPEGVAKTILKPDSISTPAPPVKAKGKSLLKKPTATLVPTPGHPNPIALNMGPNSKGGNPKPVSRPGVTLVNLDRAEAEKIEKRIEEETGEYVTNLKLKYYEII